MITRIPTIAIVGHKNSGKTTLVERLVAHYTAAGVRVAAIKHTSDEVGFDKPRTDSDRLKKAGAVAVGMVAQSEIGLYTVHTEQTSEGWMESVLASLPDPPRLILYEGYRGGPHPKIECILRPEVTKPTFRADQGLIAVVSEHAVSADVPVLGYRPLERIAEVIEAAMQRSDWPAASKKLH